VVRAGIEAACDRHGIKGLITYELFGAYDLLVRAWLPEGCEFEEFDASLSEELLPAGHSVMCDPFEVNYMVRHWPFIKPNGAQTAPEDNAIHNLQESEIVEVEADFAKASPELVERLVEENLIAPADGSSNGGTGNPGIKFAIVVGGDVSLAPDGMREFERRVIDIVDHADEVHQRSLYSGSGFGHFLILGRVGYESFHAIHSQLITQINAAPIRERYRARTMTHVSGQRGFNIVLEGLSKNQMRNGAARVAAVLPRPVVPESANELAAGDAFGARFKITKSLGGGGFAYVYCAYDKLERVDRALKVFNSPDPDVWRREIEALRKVSHPNVVKVYWGDCQDGQWYMVSEFIEGCTLKEMDKFDDVQALYIVREVLLALEAVHPNDERIAELQEKMAKGSLSEEESREFLRLRDSGLVHRDVKPENIMVSAGDKVTLVDFNIASPARDPSGKTISGTPGYQAADAGVGGWEPADDLFACGVVLYELLTDNHPHQDRQPVAGIPPVDPSIYKPDLRPALVNLLIHACAPLRAGCYQTAREMREAVEAELWALDAEAKGIDTAAARVARQIRKRRTETNITRSQLSDRSGIPPQRIEQIEEGWVEPSLAEAIELTNLLGIALDQPIDEDEEPPPDAGRDDDPPSAAPGPD
jgi:serine/threonine protein kinase